MNGLSAMPKGRSGQVRMRRGVLSAFKAPVLAIALLGALYLPSSSVLAEAVAASLSPFAVVTDQFGNTARIIDLSVEPPVERAALRVGSQPFDVAITPDGTRALVTNASSNTVSVIDLTTSPPAVIREVPVGSVPLGVAISPNGAIAVVCNAGARTISVLNPTTDPPVVIATVTIGDGISGNPRDVGITADGRFALVAFGDSFNGAALAVDLSLTPPAEVVSARIGIGKFPIGLGLDPARTVAVVPSIVENNVSILDITTFPFSKKATVAVGRNPGSKPDVSRSGLAVVPNSDDMTISIVDVASATPSVVATLSVGSDPRGAAIIDGNNVALVANRSGFTISRLKLSDFTFLSAINTPAFTPNHIAIHEGPSIVLFAAFNAKMEIELGPLANDDAFEVKANFILGNGSNGIHPLMEAVSLELSGSTGSFSTIIPAGSFKQDKKGRFKFEGTVNGVSLEARITPLGGTAFEFKAEGEHANLSNINNPVTVKLTIGNDSGSTSVTTEFGE